MHASLEASDALGLCLSGCPWKVRPGRLQYEKKLCDVPAGSCGRHPGAAEKGAPACIGRALLRLGHTMQCLPWCSEDLTQAMSAACSLTTSRMLQNSLKPKATKMMERNCCHWLRKGTVNCLSWLPGGGLTVWGACGWLVRAPRSRSKLCCAEPADSKRLTEPVLAVALLLLGGPPSHAHAEGVPQ